MTMYYILSSIIGYLLGSFPTAYIVLHLIEGKDITKEGTGNVGAMNTYEVTNSKFIGIIVLAVDALKGLLAVFLPMVILSPNEFIYPALALTFAVFSHCYNPWIKFNGGRGLATAAGGTLLLIPVMPFLWLVIFGIIYFIKREIIISNVAALILTLVIILFTSNVYTLYVNPIADQRFVALFTTGLMILILSKHFEPLQEIYFKKEVK